MLTELLTWEMALAAGIVALAGVVRGFSGFGSALILTPSLSALYGPTGAVPLVILLEVALSFQLLPSAWREAQRREVVPLTVAAIAGIPFGVWALAASDPLVLRWIISGGILLFLVALLVGVRRERQPTLRGLLGTGVLSGVMNGAAGIAGPPVVLYYLAGKGTAATLRANVILLFFAIDCVTLVAYAVQDLADQATLLRGAVSLPAAIVGVWIGSHGFRRSSEASFRAAAFGIIGAVALASLPIG
jgi:uncharacterized membrane protein YfcA